MCLPYACRNYKISKRLPINLASARWCRQSWSWNLKPCLDSIGGLPHGGTSFEKTFTPKDWWVFYHPCACREIEPGKQLREPLVLWNYSLRDGCYIGCLPIRCMIWWPFTDLSMKLEDWGWGVRAVRVGLSVDGCWMVSSVPAPHRWFSWGLWEW